VKRSVRALILGLLVATSLSATGCWGARRRWWFWRRHTAVPSATDPRVAAVPAPEVALAGGEAMKGDAR